MSKLIYFTFRCTACSKAFDDLVKPDKHVAPCPDCGAPANRIVTPVRLDYQSLAMHDGMHTSIDHFDRVHRQQRAIEKRRLEEHGDYGRAPGS